MVQKFSALFVVIVLGVLMAVGGAFFTVNEREQALVLQFGKVVKVHKEPGLKFKLPFIQEVVHYEKRLLGYNLPPSEVTAGDQERIILDLFIRYVISNPLRFYQTLQSDRAAKQRLLTIVSGNMKGVIGKVTLRELLSKNRTKIMEEIHTRVSEDTEDLGISIKDVRIIRADLPPQNSEAIFKRMESERQREAKLLRAQGEQIAKEIRADADRERSFILAKARRKATLLMGAADAKAAEIYSKAFDGGEPRRRAFFDFYYSMQTNADTLSSEDTVLVLDPSKNDFFKYFKQVAGGG